MCYCLLKGHTKKNYELVSKTEIIAAHFPTVFHSPHPTPETRGEQNHPVSQAHPTYSHTQQFTSVNVFNRTDT